MSPDTLLYIWIVAPLGFLLAVVGIAFALDALMTGRTPQGTIAWMIALVALPPVAVPMYLIFGARRFEGYVRARRRGKLKLNRVAGSMLDALAPFRSPLVEHQAERAAIERLVELPATNANHVELLIDGTATFDAIIAAVDRAQRVVLVQFYILRDDGVGRRLRDALLRARARGVACYVLYDSIGSSGLPRSYDRSLRDAGAQVAQFRTTRGPQTRLRLNFRNHRKSVVCDGRVAFVGGHNVGDEYLGLDPKFGPWRDTHLRMTGPCALCVQLAFVEDWHWATGQVPEIAWEAVAAEPIVSVAQVAGTSVAPGDAPLPDGTHVLIAPTGPADDLDSCALIFQQLIVRAKERLWIATPYFVPDQQIIGALQLAALRGVDVRVILPEKADHALAWLAAFTYYDEVLPLGIKLMRYQSGFMHQKAVLSDGVAAIGTANFDNRSFRINFEMTCLIADPAFAAQVREMLERDFARCVSVSRQDFQRRSWLFRAACRGAGLFAPIL
jgi:cardiolipin synthase